MTVYGIIGKPGNGKNCLATHLILRHIRDEKKRPPALRRRVFSNFPVYDRAYTEAEQNAGIAKLHPDVHRFERWDEVKSQPRAVVFFDEAYRLFNSREWRDCSADDIAVWTQHRKHGLTFYWIAQGANQIESTIRLNVTAKIYSVIRVLGPHWNEGNTFLEDLFGVWSIVRLWDADKFETPTKARCLGMEWLRIDRMYGRFDSTWTVADKKGIGGGQGAGLASALAEATPHLATISAVEAYQKWRTVDQFGIVRYCPPSLEGDQAVANIFNANATRCINREELPKQPVAIEVVNRQQRSTGSRLSDLARQLAEATS